MIKLKLTVNKFLPSVNKTKNSFVWDNFAVNIRNKFDTLINDNLENSNSCINCLCRFNCAGIRNFNFPQLGLMIPGPELPRLEINLARRKLKLKISLSIKIKTAEKPTKALKVPS